MQIGGLSPGLLSRRVTSTRGRQLSVQAFTLRRTGTLANHCQIVVRSALAAPAQLRLSETHANSLANRQTRLDLNICEGSRLESLSLEGCVTGVVALFEGALLRCGAGDKKGGHEKHRFYSRMSWEGLGSNRIRRDSPSLRRTFNLLSDGSGLAVGFYPEVAPLIDADKSNCKVAIES